MVAIAVHDATIKTATVEIRSLTVSGRQVTMGLFRQLEIADLIDRESATFRGLPWGRVNYFWGDCKPDHLHVVWQSGSELRRDCVRKKPLLEDYEGFGDEIRDIGYEYFASRIVSGWRTNAYTTSPEISFRGEIIKYEVNSPEQLLFTWEAGSARNQYARWKEEYRHDKALMDAENEEYRKIREVELRHDIMQKYRWVEPPDPDELALKAKALLDEKMAYLSDWRARYDELLALPQLFIAT